MNCQFQIKYWSALDNAIIRKGGVVIPQETTLIAPSGWKSDEVAEAFANQYPGATVITCYPADYDPTP